MREGGREERGQGRGRGMDDRVKKKDMYIDARSGRMAVCQ